jgi:hypothetical protein
MAKFMVLLTEDPCYWAKFGPEQMQAAIKQYVAWGMKMHAAKRIKVGHKLTDEGGKRLVAPKGKLKVSDGPFAGSRQLRPLRRAPRRPSPPRARPPHRRARHRRAAVTRARQEAGEAQGVMA